MATTKFKALTFVLGLYTASAFAQFIPPLKLPYLPPINQGQQPPQVIQPYQPIPVMPPVQLPIAQPIPQPQNPNPGFTREVCKGFNPQICYQVPER